jgi:hypothetical protein
MIFNLSEVLLVNILGTVGGISSRPNSFDEVHTPIIPIYVRDDTIRYIQATRFRIPRMTAAQRTAAIANAITT